MTISSYFTVFLQSPSNAYDIAIARCDAALAAASGAPSMSFWKISRASRVLPSVSRRDAVRVLSARGFGGACWPGCCAPTIKGAPISAAVTRARIVDATGIGTPGRMDV